MASRLQDVIQRGLSSAKPLATAVAPGTLYFSSDLNVTERSNGTIWESYNDGAATLGQSFITQNAEASLAASRKLVAGSNVAFDTTVAGDFKINSSANKISTSALASPPASPATGDLWLPNNSLYLFRYSGTAWISWGPISPLTLPVDSDFSWVNQGTATVDATNGAIYLSGPLGAGHNARIRIKAAPTVPYTITALIRPALYALNSVACGLCFRNSGSGALHLFRIVYSSGFNLFSTKYTSPTVQSADYVGTLYSLVGQIYLRIQDDNINRNCYWSVDGYHWELFHNVVRTDFLTADQVGFFVEAQNASVGAAMSLLSWAET